MPSICLSNLVTNALHSVEDLNVKLLVHKGCGALCPPILIGSLRFCHWFQHFTIFGYARSKMSDAELRNMVSKTLTCRIDKR